MTDPPLKILLVEDNPGDARLIREMIHEAGTTSFSGPRLELVHVDRLVTGLERLEHEKMAVVLLDLSLPDSQGLETFFRIQTVITTIPIIVLTGLADEDISIQAVQEGAQDYLAKGEVTGETLGRAIRYAIERHRLVTNLKQQTTARLDSEARFYNMIKQNADAIFIIDEAGMV
jgi:CheY-like chemotaxis protein